MEGRKLEISRNRRALKDFFISVVLIVTTVVLTILLWNTDFLSLSQRHEQWGLSQAIPLLVIVSAIIGVFGLRRWRELIQEIAERQRAEAQLQESEEKYRLLVENVNDAIIINRNDRILFFNKRFADMLGYDPDDLLDKGYREISTVESAALLLERKTRAEKGVLLPSRYETVFKKKDGGLIHIEANVVDIVYKGEPCTFGVFRDITERKLSDEKLQSVHDLYRKAIENSDSVLYRLNMSTNEYEFVGGRCEQILGISESEWTPDLWQKMKQEVVVTDSAGPDDWREYEEAFRRGELERYHADVRILTPDGKEKWVSDTAVLLRDDKTGEVTGSLGIAQDITDRKNAEEDVFRKNERLEILNAVAQVTTGSMTPEEMSDRLMLQIQKVLKCDAFFISSYEEKTQTVYQIRSYDTFDGEIQLVPPAQKTAQANATLMHALSDKNPVLMLRKKEELPELDTITFGDKSRKSASLLFVPLVVGDRVLGILSVQSYQINAYTQEDVELVMAIAHQFGPALEASILAKQVRLNEERERVFGETLQSLIEASNELSLTESLEELCRKAVQLGHERLGFDRIGIWLRKGEDTEEVQGTFGIGLKGEVVDKGHRILQLPSEEGIFPASEQNQNPLVIKEDISLWEDGKVVGHGYMASAAMKDRDYLLGYVCIDNLLRQQPLTEQQTKLLQLFTSTVAALCADKKREEELRKTHQIYRSSIENSNGVPYRYSYRTKEYEYIGAKCESLLGIPAEDFGPGYWVDAIRQVVVNDTLAPSNVREYSEAFKRGEVDTYRTDIRIKTPSGEEKWINDCSVPILDETTQQVICSQGILTDITQRKQFEQKLRQHQKELIEANKRLEEDIKARKVAERGLEWANKELRETTSILVHTERMNALGELTAGVAHELNQPLNNIKILCQSILRDIDKERLEMDELPQDLKDVVAQIDKMAKIIDHMRVFTRRADGVYKQKIDPNAVVKNMFVLLGQQLRTHGINVVTELPDGLPQVNADPIALEQVVTILVINARCAVEEFRTSDRKIEVKTYRYSDYEVALSVKDNGGGVPEHLQKRIFEPFFTTKPPGKGTGLGLSIAAKIIDEHNGRTELKVEKDVGSEFIVIIPTADSEEKESA